MTEKEKEAVFKIAYDLEKRGELTAENLQQALAQKKKVPFSPTPREFGLYKALKREVGSKVTRKRFRNPATKKLKICDIYQEHGVDVRLNDPRLERASQLKPADRIAAFGIIIKGNLKISPEAVIFHCEPMKKSRLWKALDESIKLVFNKHTERALKIFASMDEKAQKKALKMVARRK